MKHPDKSTHTQQSPNEEKEEVRKVLKSWNRFIINMQARGALISNSHGQTKIKI